MPAYAANQPVLTEEGYALTLADGGTLALLPNSETPCLGELEPSSAAPDVVRVVPVEISDFCGTVKVSGVSWVEAGPLLRIHKSEWPLATDFRKRERTIEVDPRLVRAVEVTGAHQEAAYFAPRTGIRSPGMVTVGSVVMGLGVLSAVAWLSFSGAADVGPYWPIPLGLFSVWAGHSIGLGVPLIVLGSRPARLPQAEQQPLPAVRVSDMGLRWSFD